MINIFIWNTYSLVNYRNNQVFVIAVYIYQYNPTVYQGLTETLPSVDDSAWIAPGFWRVPDAPLLEYSLSEFASAWSDIVANKESSRFILIETWN